MKTSDSRESEKDVAVLYNELVFVRKALTGEGAGQPGAVGMEHRPLGNPFPMPYPDPWYPSPSPLLHGGYGIPPSWYVPQYMPPRAGYTPVPVYCPPVYGGLESRLGHGNYGFPLSPYYGAYGPPPQYRQSYELPENRPPAHGGLEEIVGGLRYSDLGGDARYRPHPHNIYSNCRPYRPSPDWRWIPPIDPY
jgi:hypothetical protein